MNTEGDSYHNERQARIEEQMGVTQSGKWHTPTEEETKHFQEIVKKKEWASLLSEVENNDTAITYSIALTRQEIDDLIYLVHTYGTGSFQDDIAIEAKLNTAFKK
jgi:hypothetical protein